MKQEDVSFLANYKQFGRLLADIKNLREEAIGSLHEADTSRIQQISGKILAYDQILLMTDADEVIRRTADLP
jgi:hypothetical protein